MKVKTWITGILNDATINSHILVTNAFKKASDSDWWSTIALPQQPQSNKTVHERRFQYYLPSPDSRFILVRLSVQPPENITSHPMDFDFIKGDKVKIKVLLPSGRLKLDNAENLTPLQRKKAFELTHEEKMTYINRLMTGAGVSPSSIEYVKGPTVSIESSSKNKALKRSMEVDVIGIIEDEQLFANAILQGIGSRRGFGFGLLRISFPK